jgi:preprotein translocase subunit SecD
MKKRRIITLVVLLVLGAIVYFSLSGFSADIYTFDPLPKQVSLGLDLTGGVYTVFQAEPGSYTTDEFNAKMNTTIGVLRNRLDEKGYTEATVVRQGANTIRVEVPINETSTIKDPDQILKFISTTGLLEFKNAAGETKLTGAHVSQAYPSTSNDQATGSSQYIVALKFDAEGAKLFGELTEEAYNNKTNIVMTLDGNEISTASVKNGPIYGGEAIIEGSFTGEEVTNLAMQIESGALPLVLHEKENRSMSASLGQDALNKSLLGGLIGVCVLFVFMIGFYRLPGLVACIALSLYMYLIILIMALFPGIQLTLPGIAGIILSVGMAVDANVIIFERFKDELSAGKTLRASMKSGFHKAMTTIIDSNITTVIAGVVIAIFGVGSTKGFGYTLIIGVVVSMFTAVTITRWLLNIILDFNVKNLKLYTIRKIKPAEQALKGGE